MRKTNLAIAVFVASALSGVASAATVYNANGNTVDVYGKAELRHQNNKGVHNGVDDSYFKAGVKAKSALNEHFAAVGNYEGQFNLDTHNGARSVYGTRLLNGGIDAGAFGAVTVGRHTGAVYNVAGMSDMAPEVLSGYTAAADNGFMGRVDNTVQYQNTLGPVTVTGQYKFAKTGRSLENHWKQVNEGTGYAISAVAADIAGTGLGFGTAYSQVGLDTGRDAHAYSVGGNFVRSGVYVAATHTAGERLLGTSKFRDDEVIGQYSFDNGVTPSIGYIDTKMDTDRKQYVELGASYAFNKNVSLAVDTGTGVGSTNDHVVKTGLSYSW